MLSQVSLLDETAVSLIAFFYVFGISGVWTQDFRLERQVLYCLSHASSPFYSVILGIGSRFWLKLARSISPLFFMLPMVARITGVHMVSLFSIEMGSHRLFCLGWSGPSILLISTSSVAWNDRCAPLCPAIAWDGGLQNSLPGLASNHRSFPSQTLK
jgi:hypothetical protein